MKSIGRHWPATSDVFNPGTPSGSISRHPLSANGCQGPLGAHHFEDATQNFLSMQRLLTEQQEFMQRHAETVQSLDAEFMSHEQQQMQLERQLAELAGALKALKQEQQAQDRCVKSFQESLDSCRSSSLQCFKRVEEQQVKLEEIRADGQDCASRVEEHEVRLGVARSKAETQDQRLEWLGNRLEQQGEQLMSQVDRHCNQALQKLRNELRSELIAWCGDAFVQFRAEVAGERSENSRQSEACGEKAQAQRGLSEDALAAVQRGMVAAQRSISEVKQSLLMVLEGHSGVKREVEGLRLSVQQIADRVSAQEVATSSVQKGMNEVCASLQERIGKAETSSQRVTGLFQELREDMRRLLAEEPEVDPRLEVVQAPLRESSEETVSQTCGFRPWNRRFEAAVDVDKVLDTGGRSDSQGEKAEAASSQLEGSSRSGHDAMELPTADVENAETGTAGTAGTAGTGTVAATPKSERPQGEMNPWPKCATDVPNTDFKWPAREPVGPGDDLASQLQSDGGCFPAMLLGDDDLPSKPLPSSEVASEANEASDPPVEMVPGNCAATEPLGEAVPDEEAQSASSRASSKSKDASDVQKEALQTVHTAGASNRRRSFQALTLVDSDGEYDDDEFEDGDDLPIEIQSSRRSSLKSQE